MGSTREQELTAWLSDKGYDSSSLSVLSADASFRQYYRVNKNDIAYAVMDCPPEDESLDSFLKITQKDYKMQNLMSLKYLIAIQIKVF